MELTRTPGFWAGHERKESKRKEEEEGRKESVELTRTPGFKGRKPSERERRQKEERKESAELSRTPGFMGGTRA